MKPRTRKIIARTIAFSICGFVAGFIVYQCTVGNYAPLIVPAGIIVASVIFWIVENWDAQ